VCVTAATVYWRERGLECFGWKLDSGDGGERPRGVESRAPHARGEGPRVSTELLDRGAWPSRGLLRAPRGGLDGPVKNSSTKQTWTNIGLVKAKSQIGMKSMRGVNFFT
jgi:hypothetical protein